MIFGRRIKPGWRQRARSFIWPECGPRRATTYLLKRIARLDASPHAIAVGVAAGAAASFTPFLGFHFLIAFAFAWIARGNLLAAAFGTALGNPLTFPLIFASTYETGRFVLGLIAVNTPSAADAEHHGQALLNQGFLSSGFAELWPVVKTMAIGAIPLGAIAFIVFYLLFRSAVSGFQRARRGRRARRATLRGASLSSGTKTGAPAKPRSARPARQRKGGHGGAARNAVDGAPVHPSG